MKLKLNRVFKNNFFKNSMLYTVGAMLTPLIGLIMLPIYTRFLTTSEYAIMTTTQTLVGMFNLFLVLSLHGAITRFYYDFLDNPTKQKEYLGSIFSFVLTWASIVVVILYIFKNPIGSILFKNIPTNPYFIYLLGISWVNALYELPMALYRAREKAGTFVIINIVRAVSIMLVTMYLIIGKDFGAEAALLSQFLITLIIIFFTYGKQLKSFKFRMNKKFIQASLLFSLPLLPHVASGWIISSSDRIILEKFIDLKDLGIYALAVQVSMILSIFYTSVNNALVPRYTLLRKKEKFSEADKILKYFSYIVLIFGVMSVPISMYAIKLISSYSYHDAMFLMPLLLLGHMIKGFYFMPVAKLFYVKKTGAIATSSTIAALINVIVNLIMIPIIGIYGAIVSTLIAEMVRYLMILRASRVYQKKIKM